VARGEDSRYDSRRQVPDRMKYWAAREGESDVRGFALGMHGTGAPAGPPARASESGYGMTETLIERSGPGRGVGQTTHYPPVKEEDNYAYAWARGRAAGSVRRP
jgi:hypothetical protein